MGQPNGVDDWRRDSIEAGATFMPLSVPIKPENDYQIWAQESRGWRKLLAAIVGGAALGTKAGQDHAKTLVSAQSVADAAGIFWAVFNALSWLEAFIRNQSEAIAGKDRAWQGQAADAFLTKMDWLGDILGNQADRFSTVDGITSAGAVPQQLYQSAHYLAWAQTTIKQLDYDYAAWASANQVGGANGMISISGTPYERPMALQMASVVDKVAIEYDKVRAAATVSAGNGDFNIPTPNPNATATSPTSWTTPTFTTPNFTTVAFTTPNFTTPVISGPGATPPLNFTTPLIGTPPPVGGGPGPGPGGQFTTPLLSTPNIQGPGPGPGFTTPIFSSPLVTPPVVGGPGPIATPPVFGGPGPITPPLFSTPVLGGPNGTPPLGGVPGGFPTPPIFSNPNVTPPGANNPGFTPPVVSAPGNNPGLPMFPPPFGMPGGGQNGSGGPEKPDANGLLGGNQQPWKPGGLPGIDLPGAPGGAVPGGLGLGSAGPGAPFLPGMPGPAGPAGGGGNGQAEKPDANGLLANEPDDWQPDTQGIDLPDTAGGTAPGGLGLSPAVDPVTAPVIAPIPFPLPVPSGGRPDRPRLSDRGQEDDVWRSDGAAGPGEPAVDGQSDRNRDRDEPPPVVVVPTVVEASIVDSVGWPESVVAAGVAGTAGALMGAVVKGQVPPRPSTSGEQVVGSMVRGQEAEERDEPPRPDAGELLHEDEHNWDPAPVGLRVPTVRPEADDRSAWDDTTDAAWLTGQTGRCGPDERSADA